MDWKLRVANAIFDVLMREGGVQEFDRLTFVWRFCNTSCTEFELPFNKWGKSAHWLCYTRTPTGLGFVCGVGTFGERDERIERANAGLRRLAVSIQAMPPLQRREWAEAG